MAELYEKSGDPPRIYHDRLQFPNFMDQLAALKGSKLLYVGNVSFYTTEQQIRSTFEQIGPVKRVIMGLNSMTKTPCGFCFVEFYKSDDALACLKYISNTACDEQIIRCELDAGFVPGRQFGRGRSGGQVRDDRYKMLDLARGGLVNYGAFKEFAPAIEAIASELTTSVSGDKRKRDNEENDDAGDQEAVVEEEHDDRSAKSRRVNEEN